MSRITGFIGAAVLGLCMLAFAPAAYAIDQAPDICVLDLSQPASIDHAIETSDATCLLVSAEVTASMVSRSGDQGDAARPAFDTHQPFLDFASYRQHFDPGRLLV